MIACFTQRRKPKRGDFEGKSSADEREAYEGTLSEETAIEIKTLIKRRKPQVFNLRFFSVHLV
jgi:hypothetical protein